MSRKVYSREEIEKKINSLPPEVRNLLYSSEVDGIIQQVGNKNQLHIDQLGNLLAETNDVLCGFTNIEELSSNLIDSLQVDKTKAEMIVRDLNDQLFLKIRESMKKITPQSAVQASQPSTPATPISINTAPKPPTTVTSADMMLSQSTVSKPQSAPVVPPTPKVEAPKPAPYKADPYREPPE